MQLKSAIEALNPSAILSGAVGRTSSFEVQVTVGDGEPTLVHSKLASGSFPAFADLAKTIVASARI